MSYPAYTSQSLKTAHEKFRLDYKTSGKTLPSMTEFFAICDYFGITPIEFFNEKVSNPQLSQAVLSALELLDEEDQKLMLLNINRLLRK